MFFLEGGGQKTALRIDPTGKAVGDRKSEAEASVGKLAVRRIGSVVPLKRDLSEGGEGGRWEGRGYHFAEEGGKFVLRVLAEMLLFALAFRRKMSHRAAQAWRAVLRARPWAACCWEDERGGYTPKEKRSAHAGTFAHT